MLATSNPNNAEIFCLYCGRIGHPFRECRTRARDRLRNNSNSAQQRETITLNTIHKRNEESKDPVVICQVENLRCPLLVDTGSRVTLIAKDLLKQFGSKRQKKNPPKYEASRVT